MPRFNRFKIPTVVLFIESSRASGRALLRGISEYARRHGPWAFYWEPGGFEKISRRLESVAADGIVLRDVEGLEEVLRYDVPTIVVGHSRREIRGFSNVITDSLRTASLAAEHLIDCGFPAFGFVGYDGNPWSDARRDAFVGLISQAGLATQVYPSGKTGEMRSPRAESKSRPWKGEPTAMAEWLKKLALPVGIMACNDDRAENVVEACKLAKLRVPEDVGIIGADNDELVCELAHPPLSSVAINFERAGFETARLLHQMMLQPRQSRTHNILVEATHVVPRQSTDILFIDDVAVARAVRFLRQNARRQISVEDVAQAAGLSRRVLERRFHSVVNRSVLREIRRARVEQICRMLADTNQSVSEIAMATGFPGVEHFARYFRQEKQTTPLSYRKSYGRQ
jgi:LacI family transcriptional regulator, galactose operon repressor